MQATWNPGIQHPSHRTQHSKILLLCLTLLGSAAHASKQDGQNYYAKGQYAQALEELKWEAMQGDRESQTLVGLMFLRGQGTEKDAVQAAYWFGEAARQDDPAAQAALGELYLAGNGLPQDDQWAMYWTRQAADHGNPEGQVTLGKLYLEGRATERDPQTALEWFQRAATGGHAEGQYQLAQLLERGEGTRQDTTQALKWYHASAAQGYKAAQDAMQRLTGTRPTPTPVPTGTVNTQVKPTTTSAPLPAPAPERTAPTTQKKRIALLIANQDYRDHTLDLTGPINDAKLIETSLKKAGFQVTTKTNLTLGQMNLELSRFLDRVDSNTVSLVYYSGHGVEVNGANYLIPTDFQMTSSLTGNQAISQSVDIAAYYARMTAQAEGSLNITILDACRNNPFKGRGLKTLGNSGLKAVSLPGGNGDGTIETFTAYAASSGQVAQDGVQNGPYAAALAQQMSVPGQVLEVTFRNVRMEVTRRTAGTQIPTSYANISSEFIFTPAK